MVKITYNLTLQYYRRSTYVLTYLIFLLLIFQIFFPPTHNFCVIYPARLLILPIPFYLFIWNLRVGASMINDTYVVPTKLLLRPGIENYNTFTWK